MAIQEGLFEFNLLQTKTRKELAEEEKRDESTFYTMILLFSGVIIFLLLHLLDLLLVESRIVQLNNDLAQIEDAIDSKVNIRRKNGELVVKSERLSPVLAQDIKLIDFLDIADNIVGNNIEITSYIRNDTGAFVIDFYVNNEAQALEILRKAQNQNNVVNPFINSIQVEEDNQNELRVSLEFNITSPLEDAT